ncbi:MAG: galactokinase, partial [Halioglobus sp.]
MLANLKQVFAECYGVEPEQVIKAPGRVNLIGEHTDYNQGFVLPCALEYHTLVSISGRDDKEVHVLALDSNGETDCFHLDQPIAFHLTKMWANYVRGVVVALQNRGHSLHGCNIAVTGNIPQGAGLSSSAALEVAVARAITAIAGVELSPLELARVGQDAENEFVGCNSGIMDQLISVTGKAGHAMAIDCKNINMEPVAIPEGLSIVLINSNVRRGLVDSEYNLRREQCEAAARHFGAT